MTAHAWISPGQAVAMADAFAGRSPIFGRWMGAVESHSWVTAIVPASEVGVSDYQYVGYFTTPVQHFAPGESMLFLNDGDEAGAYVGMAKWRNAYGPMWYPTKLVLRSDGSLFMTNAVPEEMPRMHRKDFALYRLQHSTGVPQYVPPEAGDPALLEIAVTASQAEVPFRPMGTGWVAAGGAVVTNWHVVEHAREIRVALSDGRELSSRVEVRDVANDLALLAVDAPDELPPALPISSSPA